MRNGLAEHYPPCLIIARCENVATSVGQRSAILRASSTARYEEVATDMGWRRTIRRA